jgi:thiol-disulfide isomerase/thioredoxin
MHVHRTGFLTTAAAFLALPVVARADKLPPHVHGLNGVALSPIAATNLTIRVLDGPDFALQAHRGSVVMMNFFATWCPGCREEAPAVESFASAHADDTVVIGVDFREQDDTVRAFRKKYGLTYPIGMDEQGGYFQNIGLRYFPSTLIFRPDGTLSCVHAGSIDAGELVEERRIALPDAGDGNATDPPPSPSPP